VTSVCVHDRQHTGKTMSQVMAPLHHKEQRCWIAKNEHSHLEVLNIGRGVGVRQRAWKRAAGGVPLTLHDPQ
jgi:hypothetical protein